MFKRLQRVAAGGFFLRGLLRELHALRVATERVADALEHRTKLDHPHAPPLADIRAREAAAQTDGPVVEVSFSDPATVAEWDEIIESLTRARGAAPTEEEILEEYERRRVGAAHAEPPVWPLQ